MSAQDDIARLVKEASASLKGDLGGALAKLQSAFELARQAGVAEDSAMVAEELARALTRRKAPARSLHYAAKATKLAPERKAAWTTLAKTCELLATRTQGEHKQGRARVLYRGAGAAFERAAKLTKDPEDKRWLLELAGDAKKQAAPPKPR